VVDFTRLPHAEFDLTLDLSAPGYNASAVIGIALGMGPGAVRDRAVQFTQEWFGLLVQAVQDAQAEGAISSSEDPVQLAFELNAYLLLANAQLVATGERRALELARRALHRRLAQAA